MTDESARDLRDEKPLVYARAGDEPGLYTPVPTGVQAWRPGQMPGPGVTGLLTREAVRAAKAIDPGLRLARASYDLFTVARMTPTRVRTQIVRQGRRIALIDAFLEQDGRSVARAHVFFAHAGESPDNGRWQPGVVLPPVPCDVPSSPLRRVFHSAETGWVSDTDVIPAEARRALWQRPLQLVEGEATTGYALAGYGADLTNLVVNSGAGGLLHINVEATLSLSRAPRGEHIGLLATSASESDGISAGSAVLFDEDGPIGVSSVSAIVQAPWPEPPPAIIGGCP